MRIAVEAVGGTVGQRPRVFVLETGGPGDFLRTRSAGRKRGCSRRRGSTPRRRSSSCQRTGVRLRVLSSGSGRPVLLLHGVAGGAAAWAPLLEVLAGYRLHAVDLPGHGLSGPVAYRRREVRGHTVQLIDDLYDALALEPSPVVAHSLGGMFALW